MPTSSRHRPIGKLEGCQGLCACPSLLPLFEWTLKERQRRERKPLQACRRCSSLSVQCQGSSPLINRRKTRSLPTALARAAAGGPLLLLGTTRGHLVRRSAQVQPQGGGLRATETQAETGYSANWPEKGAGGLEQEARPE